MRIETFTARADLMGRRVWLHWTLLPQVQAGRAAAPRLVVRRKRRDFAFPPLEPQDPYTVYDTSDAFLSTHPSLVATELPARERTEGDLRIREETTTYLEVVKGAPDERLRRVLRTVLAPDHSLLRQEVELLDVGGTGKALVPGVTYYYRLEAPEADAATRQELQATATPGDLHGLHRNLYDLVPEVYRRHDTVAREPDAATGLLPEASTAGGQLRRFTDLFGAGLDALRSSAHGLLALRDVTSVDHRFLPLLAQWIGWELTAHGNIAGQRDEIASATRLYGAVGTVPALCAVVGHHTGRSALVSESVQHVARSNAAPQRNLFAAVLRDDSWWGVDVDAPVPGFVSHGPEPAGGTRTGAPGAPTSAGLVSLRGAPQGRLATVVDARGRVSVVHADTADGPPRLTVKPLLGRRWYDSRPVEERPVAPEADPAAVALADGWTWLAWVEHPGTAAARLRWRRGAYRPLTPAQLRGAASGPFPLVVGARMVVTGYGATETFTVDASDYADPGAATATEVAAAVETMLTGVVAAVSPDGSLTLSTKNAGPDVELRVDLAASTAARSLGFGDRHRTGRGGWDPAIDWEPASCVNGVPVGRHADCTAVAESDDAVRLFWSTWTGSTWRLARTRWDGRLLVSTTAGVAVQAENGTWTALSTDDGLPDDDVRGVAVDADGREWFATAAGAAVRLPNGTVTVMTAAAPGGGPADDDLRAVAVALDGTVWFPHGAGASARRPNGSWVTVDQSGGMLPSNDVRHVVADGTGAVWFGTADGVTRHGTDGTWRTWRTADGLKDTDVRHIAPVPDGSVWIATGGGACRIAPDGTAHPLDLAAAGLGLAVADVRCALGEPALSTAVPEPATAGPLWLATVGGLVEVRSPRDVRLHTVAHGLPSDDCRTVAAGPDGAIWVGTAGGLARRGPDGRWQHVTDPATPFTGLIHGLHGPWAAPLWFPSAGAGDRDPHVVREGTRLWLAWAERQATADPEDTWLLRLRHCDQPTAAWSEPVSVTTRPVSGAEPSGRVTDRGPSVLPLGGGAARLFFRSDRAGGSQLWWVDVTSVGAAGLPVQITTGPAADGHPAAVTLSDGTTLLLFRSDRNVPLGELGHADSPSESGPGTRRASEQATVRRFAGSVSATLGDRTRNENRGQFGDLLDYTPQRPAGDRLLPHERYAPNTITVHLDRSSADGALTRADAEWVRRLLEGFLPVNVRVVAVPLSGEFHENEQ